MASNTLRIIGGEHRGRKLRFPDARGLRPTADRVRETLFNWLQFDIRGAACLDLFAGSGALGFEALSRGAAYVLMVEQARDVARQLQVHRETLGFDQQLDIVQQDAVKLLQGEHKRKFDIVFVDPPFADRLLPEVCELLEQQDWLAEEAWIYIEQDSSHDWPSLPESWCEHRAGQAGQAAFRLMQRGTIDSKEV
ncbi:MAG: 16S rRNA (guanine(966)-N(2))-methyltransferase RsmD [bacterium]